MISLYITSSTEKKTDPITKQRELNSFDSTFNSFQLYVESCVNKLTKEAIENFGASNTAISNYLKLSTTNCLNASIFKEVEVEIKPPLVVVLKENNNQYLVDLEINIRVSKYDLRKEINKFSFSIEKSAVLPGSGIGSIKIDNDEFLLSTVEVTKEPYKDGELIIHYTHLPDNMSEYEIALESFHVINKEPIYSQEDFKDYEFDKEIKEVLDNLLFDEKIVFNQSLISYEEIRTKLLEFDFVGYISRNHMSSPDYVYQHLFHESSQGNVKDEFYRYQWYLNNMGQFFGVPGADINIEEAWDLSKGDEDIIISVIDQGIFSNIDLKENLLYEKSFNLVDRTSNIGPKKISEYHGTHVAGVIASGTDNYLGIAGICPNCKIINMKVMDSESGADSKTLINAVFLSIANGADIISMSLGGTESSFYEEQIFNSLAEKGIIFVAAAGNEGLNRKNYPAGYEGVISVAATNNIDQLATFSNYGDWVDIAAPGELILSSCGITSYCFSSGTSMATPIVTGVIGLMKSIDKNLSPKEIKSILKSNSNNIGSNIRRINAGKIIKSLD